MFTNTFRCTRTTTATVRSPSRPGPPNMAQRPTHRVRTREQKEIVCVGMWKRMRRWPELGGNPRCRGASDSCVVRHRRTTTTTTAVRHCPFLLRRPLYSTRPVAANVTQKQGLGDSLGVRDHLAVHLYSNNTKVCLNPWTIDGSLIF
jgi:hypothetical protein